MEHHGCFFKRDKSKIVDYVIVIDAENLRLLETYIRNLEGIGLEFEIAKGIEVVKDFILIHIPQKALDHFGTVFDVGIQEGKPNVMIRKFLQFDFFKTPLSYFSDVRKKGEFTSCERIIIINKLLESTRYGDGTNQIGLSKLIRIGTVSTAYPLHEGSLKLGDSNILEANNRQLLYHYWANFSLWYKEIPLDMVKTYFGCEVAFYFGWLEFFNVMLIPATIFGIIVFIISMLTVFLHNHSRVMEMCSANQMYLCPTCIFGYVCEFKKKVSDFCPYGEWDFVSDNHFTVAFAIFMSFWATFFINIWRRRSNILKLRWEVEFESADVYARPEYLDRVKTTKYNYITRRWEPYLPTYKTVARIAFSVSVCIFMIFLVVAAVLSIIIIKISMKTAFLSTHYFRSHHKALIMCFGCILQVIFIKIFGSIYGKLSIWLTNFENPRTQKQYDNSVLYKRYMLAFANNYTALFYIAFVKGRLYDRPDTIIGWSEITKDTCHPLTCVVDLSTLLFFLIVFKRMIGNLFSLLCPPIKRFMRKILRLKSSNPSDLYDLPQYEEEYHLLPTNRYLLTSEFCEMVIEFGFITFFVSSFPLGPLLSLIKTTMEMRLDAYKLVARYRRPVPRIVSGIGAWDGVLLGVTYLSTATNAFVISFTSDFVAREVYMAKHAMSLVGYVNSTLSEFATKDYDAYLKHGKPKVDICYYRAMRQPPTEPYKYELTSDYWTDITWRLISVLIFEHVILVANAILSYAIPDVPKSVRDQLKIDRKLAREAAMKMTKEDLSKGMQSRQRKGDPQLGPIAGYNL